MTEKMKKQVAAAYGIPWSDHALYEFDHLIPRELAGRDDTANLWPDPWVLIIDHRDMGARQKDRAENAARKATCDGRITLAEAQRLMATDWTVLYLRFVGNFPQVVP